MHESGFTSPTLRIATQRLTRVVALAGVILTSSLYAGSAAVRAAASPPAQPTSGPGGSQTQFSSYSISGPLADESNNGKYASDTDMDYYTITPSGTYNGQGTAPSSLPVVVFLHAATETSPTDGPAAWIEHLAEMGNYVIWPKVGSDLTHASYFEWNAWNSLSYALTQTTGTYTPDTALGMNLIGYSEGGAVAIDLANDWNYPAKYNLPVLPTPISVLLANPWDGANSTGGDMMDSSLSSIPATTRVDCVVGDMDGALYATWHTWWNLFPGPTNSGVGRSGCDKIWERIPQVTHKDYVWMFSDDDNGNGSPVETADHEAPAYASPFAFYGYWKLGDALIECAETSSNCAYAQGGGSQETYMGTWSDGTPFTPLEVTEGSAAPPCPSEPADVVNLGLPSVSGAAGCEFEPTIASVSPVNSGSLSVSWSDAFNGVTQEQWESLNADYAWKFPDPHVNTMWGWRVTATPVSGGTPVTIFPAPTATSATITGLTSGTRYNVTVALMNWWAGSQTTTTNAPSQPVSGTPN